jgi:hypothetical protein
MSASPFYSIQESIYSILTLDPGLMNRVTGVFDYVPANQQFPYVTIGEFNSTDWGTYGYYGEEVYFTLHIWSRYQGMKECEIIANDLNRLLARQSFFIDGWGNVGCWFDNRNTIRDSDGYTRHCIVRYRLLVLSDDPEG